jgi:hypothetical protein
MLKPPEDNVSLLAGNRVDVFCETCWRVWQTVLEQAYDDLTDFDERNSLVCPWCNGGHSRAARPSDITIKPKGGDRT